MPPKRFSNNPKGNLNNSFLASNLNFILIMDKADIPNTKSQLLVCGAPIKTHFIIPLGIPPTTFQPVIKKRNFEKARPNIMINPQKSHH